MAKAKNGHGGARAGAGRPPKPPYPAEGVLNARTYPDPLSFLLAAMADPDLDFRSRVDVARVALPYVHPKVADAGKKDSAKAAATKAASGKYAPAKAPRLVSDNGKAVDAVKSSITGMSKKSGN